MRSAPDERPDEIVIDAAATLRLLLISIAALTVLNFAGLATYLLPDFPMQEFVRNIFRLDGEANVPTLLSVAMPASGAILSIRIARERRRRDASFARHWKALSLLLCIVALDEFVSFHEALSYELTLALDIERGPFFYAWIIPGAAIVTGIGIAFVSFVRALPLAVRRYLILGAAVLTLGAIGVEIPEGMYAAIHTQDSLGYVLMSSGEEILEMLGGAFLLYAVMLQAAVELPQGGLTIRVGHRAADRSRQS